ncbi:MAG: hypothetical protein Q7K25_09110 [Actinomycetota bacterium]|nr:hypothetical protein [Actinomycetota bacterium]
MDELLRGLATVLNERKNAFELLKFGLQSRSSTQRAGLMAQAAVAADIAG